jgi:hypothetical protein
LVIEFFLNSNYPSLAKKNKAKQSGKGGAADMLEQMEPQLHGKGKSHATLPLGVQFMDQSENEDLEEDFNDEVDSLGDEDLDMTNGDYEEPIGEDNEELEYGEEDVNQEGHETDYEANMNNGSFEEESLEEDLDIEENGFDQDDLGELRL